MRLRQATLKDARLLFEWANDPATRAQSFTTDPIPWTVHIAWLERVLSDPDRRLFVAEDDGPIGTVRLDGNVLSLTVAPEHRGKGYAARLIRAAAALVPMVIAEVKPDNERSLRAFRSAGFVEVERDEVRVVFQASFEKFISASVPPNVPSE